MGLLQMSKRVLKVLRVGTGRTQMSATSPCLMHQNDSMACAPINLLPASLGPKLCANLLPSRTALPCNLPSCLGPLYPPNPAPAQSQISNTPYPPHSSAAQFSPAHSADAHYNLPLEDSSYLTQRNTTRRSRHEDVIIVLLLYIEYTRTIAYEAQGTNETSK